MTNLISNVRQRKNLNKLTKSQVFPRNTKIAQGLQLMLLSFLSGFSRFFFCGIPFNPLFTRFEIVHSCSFSRHHEWEKRGWSFLCGEGEKEVNPRSQNEPSWFICPATVSPCVETGKSYSFSFSISLSLSLSLSLSSPFPLSLPFSLIRFRALSLSFGRLWLVQGLLHGRTVRL